MWFVRFSCKDVELSEVQLVEMLNFSQEIRPSFDWDAKISDYQA